MSKISVHSLGNVSLFLIDCVSSFIEISCPFQKQTPSFQSSFLWRSAWDCTIVCCLRALQAFTFTMYKSPLSTQSLFAGCNCSSETHFRVSKEHKWKCFAHIKRDIKKKILNVATVLPSCTLCLGFNQQGLRGSRLMHSAGVSGLVTVRFSWPHKLLFRLPSAFEV